VPGAEVNADIGNWWIPTRAGVTVCAARPGSAMSKRLSVQRPRIAASRLRLGYPFGVAKGLVRVGPMAEAASAPPLHRAARTLGTVAGSRRSRVVRQGAALWAVRVLVGVGLTRLAFLALPTGASLPHGARFTVDTFTDPTGKKHGLLDGLLRWDALHYIHLSRFGYPVAPRGSTSNALAAFFPLYPLLVRFVATIAPVGGADRYRVAAIVVSWAALLSAVLGVMLVAREWSPRGDPRDAALAFAWFPASVFLLAGYTESLFAALLAWALYAFARRRFVVVAILAGLCAATRAEGAVVVILILGTMVKRQLPIAKGLLLCAVSEAGLITYALFCWARYGSPLAFIDAEKFWHRKITYPLHPELWFVRSVIDGHAGNGSGVAVFALSSIAAVLAVAGSVALVVFARRSLVPVPVALVAVALVLLAISSGPGGLSPEAVARYTMTVVPLYILVPGIVRRLPSGRSWLLGAAMLAGFFQVLFTLGYWFT
jgi:hypothetical protein